MPARKVPRSIAGGLPPPERYREAAPFGRRPRIMAKRTNASFAAYFFVLLFVDDPVANDLVVGPQPTPSNLAQVVEVMRKFIATAALAN
jgi:hypothetical protein